MPDQEHPIVHRLSFRGFHGCQCVCSLETFQIEDGRVVGIATELADNRGTSITNVAEYLASHVCDRFGIAPNKLVWIETYGYPVPGGSKRERTFDLVTFTLRKPESIDWAPAVRRQHPDGWPGHFCDPEWHPMTDDDWRSLGLAPRRPSV